MFQIKQSGRGEACIVLSTHEAQRSCRNSFEICEAFANDIGDVYALL